MTARCDACGRVLPVRILNLVVQPVVALVCGSCIGKAFQREEVA